MAVYQVVLLPLRSGADRQRKDILNCCVAGGLSEIKVHALSAFICPVAIICFSLAINLLPSLRVGQALHGVNVFF